MSSNETRENMKAALGRVGGKPGFIGSLFVTWENAFGPSVSRALNCGDDMVVTLGLCLRPRAEAWERDVDEIAVACGIDASRLASFLRQALAVERLAGAPPVSEAVDGRLLAARDREYKHEE
jgi:hypothetical protein